jgi:hypothetical protein
MENHSGGFVWSRYPQAEEFILKVLGDYLQGIPTVARFQNALTEQTGTRLYDWLDHLVMAGDFSLQKQLEAWGFQPVKFEDEQGGAAYRHPGASFPAILLRSGSNAPPGIVLEAAVGVENVSSFLMAQRVSVPIDGGLLAPFRKATVWCQEGNATRKFHVVERRNSRGFLTAPASPDHSRKCLEARECWIARPRDFSESEQGLESTLSLARSLVEDLGQALAAWVIFEAERAYWQHRNGAAAVQKAQQDSFGLGWGNHDHHTFRCSRQCFAGLILILETLGFQARERFYAGAQAGWGAQVMDQPECGLTVFADVDLAPEEVDEDFSHLPLQPRQQLGTVGLWCALHGESILSAGLHHLACRMSFDSAVDLLAGKGIPTMPPFSHFPFLRQAFTKGEPWKVLESRLSLLERSGRLNQEQTVRFQREGAVGSHLEIIQRGEGYKGFNQQAVSDIIRRTDPRGGNGEISA